MGKTPFDSLSPEIKNMIFEEVFANVFVHLDQFDKGPGAVVQVCRTLRYGGVKKHLFGTAKVVLPPLTGLTQSVWLPKECDIPPGTLLRHSQMLYTTFEREALHAIPNGLIAVKNQVAMLAFVNLDCAECNPGHVAVSRREGKRENPKINYKGELEFERTVLVAGFPMQRKLVHIGAYCRSSR